MLKVQRRLRGSMKDPGAREFLKLKGLSIQQALLWKPSDAGGPPSERTTNDGSLVDEAIGGLNVHIAALRASDAA